MRYKEEWSDGRKHWRGSKFKESRRNVCTREVRVKLEADISQMNKIDWL